MERSRCISPEGDTLPSLPEEWRRSIGNVDHRLYGGAQYHRALREMALIVNLCPTSPVSEEEVALAGGVGEVHDGPNFLRAACLIAMEKAYGSFEPLLDSFTERCEYIMKKTFDAVEYQAVKEYAAEESQGTSDGKEAFPRPFRSILRRIYEDFVERKAEEAKNHCKEDLQALTKFITWDLEQRGEAGLEEAIGEGGQEAVQVYSVAIDKAFDSRRGGGKNARRRNWRNKRDEGDTESDDIMAQWAEANGDGSIDKDVNEESEDGREHLDEGTDADLFSGNDSGDFSGGRSEDKKETKTREVNATPEGDTIENPVDDQKLLAALEEVASRTDIDKTSAVINELVRHLSLRWRNNFARQVAVKFNCFFLLTFMEDFSQFLRKELLNVQNNESDLLGKDGNFAGSLFDVDEMKQNLLRAEREMEAELENLIAAKRKMEREIELDDNFSSSSSTSPPPPPLL